ncbi:hypothetical protein ACHAPT_004861 [Fusarium lateritium]
MQPKYLSLLAAMATTALANEIKHVEVVHVLKALNVRSPVLGFTPNKRNTDADNLFARADDDKEEECSSSIMALFADVPTPTGDLKDWFLDVVAAPTADPCKLTIASSLSKPLESYITKFGEYLISKNDEAEKIAKDCDVDPQEGVGLVPECSGGGGSIYFTDASTTKVASLIYQTAGATGNAAAPRATGMVGAVAAAVGAAGAAVMAL